MRIAHRLLSVPLAAVFLSLGGVSQTHNVSSPSKPSVVIDLRKTGWAPVRSESNRSFFKDFTLEKLESLDDQTRLVFLSGEVIVFYHTKQQGQDWHTASRELEAFFVSSKDGSLISTKQWPTMLRKSGNDLRDSEGRLIPLRDGRFLVLANGEMMLYASDFDLIKQQKLAPSGLTDLWSVQGVADGREIFLRHESSSDLRVTYAWLASNTLEILHEMPGYQGHGFSVQGGVVASTDAVFAGSSSGVRMSSGDQESKMVCDDQL